MKIRITAVCEIEFTESRIPATAIVEAWNKNAGEQAFDMLSDAASARHENTSFVCKAEVIEMTAAQPTQQQERSSSFDASK